ncbi:MAG: hypothetical protein K6B72_06920 [Lachnospiraceae bacterium]|nr:hypothetical protein [Lachnospiraceae bacterium]
MTIIQNESRFDNIRKIHEMRDFFDWDEELEKVMRERDQNRNCLILSEILYFVLWGILYYLYLSGRSWYVPRVELIRFEILCLCSLGAVGWYSWRERKIRKSEVLQRYSLQDMFLYFLLGDGFVESIRLSRDRKTATFYWDDGNTKVPIEGYTLEGTGREVQTVDLDRHVIYTGD